MLHAVLVCGAESKRVYVLIDTYDHFPYRMYKLEVLVTSFSVEGDQGSCEFVMGMSSPRILRSVRILVSAAQLAPSMISVTGKPKLKEGVSEEGMFCGARKCISLSLKALLALCGKDRRHSSSSTYFPSLQCAASLKISNEAR